MQSGTKLEGPIDKRDNIVGKKVEKDTKKVVEKDTYKEPITIEKEQTSKAKEVVKKDKEQPYVPRLLTYGCSLFFKDTPY